MLDQVSLPDIGEQKIQGAHFKTQFKKKPSCSFWLCTQCLQHTSSTSTKHDWWRNRFIWCLGNKSTSHLWQRDWPDNPMQQVDAAQPGCLSSSWFVWKRDMAFHKKRSSSLPTGLFSQALAWSGLKTPSHLIRPASLFVVWKRSNHGSASLIWRAERRWTTLPSSIRIIHWITSSQVVPCYRGNPWIIWEIELFFFWRWFF